MISTFLSAARSAAVLLHTPELAESWTKPSALAEFRVSGLAGQVGNVTASSTPRCLRTCR
ncbi:MAG TPA: hypothetical protein VGD48_19265 [Kutzneria sp.]